MILSNNIIFHYITINIVTIRQYSNEYVLFNKFKTRINKRDKHT